MKSKYMISSTKKKKNFDEHCYMTAEVVIISVRVLKESFHLNFLLTSFILSQYTTVVVQSRLLT